VLRFSDDSGREVRSFAPFRGLGFLLHDATQGLRPGLHLCRRSAARKDFSHGLSRRGLGPYAPPGLPTVTCLRYSHGSRAVG
jgi:hypothetical protein